MMRIVVVEDEIRIREGISRLLKKLNEEYEIVGAAENGQEGLALIRELKPDVVITDIRMPVMAGLLDAYVTLENHLEEYLSII